MKSLPPVKVRKIPSLSGKVFGNWTVKEEYPRALNEHIYYKCICACGNEGRVDHYHLLNEASTGCKNCIKKKICKKGHDTLFCGREENYKCKLCRVEGHIRRTYGLSLDDYKDLYVLQKGLCAICSRPLLLNAAFGIVPAEGDATRAEVDHKHIPKKEKPQPEKRSTVRGLLCGGRYAGCNAKLGHVDNILWLQAAVKYLSDPPANQVGEYGRRLRKG